MQDLGIEGGIYYKVGRLRGRRPVKCTRGRTLVKVRGPGYAYQPRKEPADLYGFHLTAIPNGSFEDGIKSWAIKGRGTAQPTPLDETDVPWRGSTFPASDRDRHAHRHRSADPGERIDVLHDNGEPPLLLERRANAEGKDPEAATGGREPSLPDVQEAAFAICRRHPSLLPRQLHPGP